MIPCFENFGNGFSLWFHDQKAKYTTLNDNEKGHKFHYDNENLLIHISK